MSLLLLPLDRGDDDDDDDDDDDEDAIVTDGRQLLGELILTGDDVVDRISFGRCQSK